MVIQYRDMLLFIPENFNGRWEPRLRDEENNILAAFIFVYVEHEVHFIRSCE